MRDPWILQARPGHSSGGVRLFCLPHAGGGAAVFRNWPRHLEPEVETLPVQLPGRANRLREKPYTRLSTLARTLACALEPFLDRPYAFFGHSLGALVAFEVTRELRRRDASPPVRLFVSARRGPRRPDPGQPIHSLADEAFVLEVERRYGGIPEAVRREPAVMELLLPSLRADFEMLDTYEYVEGELLDCPVTALRGREDPRVPLEELQAWSQETRGMFSLYEFAGGHFFFQQAEEAVAALVRRQLEGAVAPLPQ